MMRFILILFITMAPVTAYADDVFPDKDTGDLYVIQVDKNEGKALIRDRDGNEAEVYIGDRLGFDGADVVEIDRASITIQVDNTKTRIPILPVEGMRKLDTRPVGGKSPSLRSE